MATGEYFRSFAQFFNENRIKIGMFPSSYKLAMTYEEQLLWLFKFVEEELLPMFETFIDLPKELERFRSDIVAYVENEITGFRQEINENIKKNNEIQYNNLTAYADNILTLANQFAVSEDNKLRTEILSRIQTVQNNLDYNIKDLQLQIDKIEREGIKILNPTTGKMETLSFVIQSLFDLMRDNSLTAQEYDNLGLTAKEYDDLLIGAYSYDWNSKVLLMP